MKQKIERILVYLPTKEEWIEWEKKSFDVTVRIDSFDGTIELSVTHNGNNWTSIRFLDKDQLRKVVNKCQEFLDK